MRIKLDEYDKISKEDPLSPDLWFNHIVKCGRCGKVLDILEHIYCPQCGQKIDWTKIPKGFHIFHDDYVTD